MNFVKHEEEKFTKVNNFELQPLKIFVILVQ